MSYQNPFNKSVEVPSEKRIIGDLPAIEFFRGRDEKVQTLMSSKVQKHGDYQFMQCPDGFVVCFINGYEMPHSRDSFYGVGFLKQNPL